MKEKSSVVDGMVSERESTDKVWGFFFVLFVLIWCAVCVFSFTEGGIQKAMRVNDFDGVLCGGPEALEYPVMYFSKPDLKNAKGESASLTQLLEYGTCVKACPSKDQLTECLTNSKVLACLTSKYETIQFTSLCIPGFDGELQKLEKEI